MNCIGRTNDGNMCELYIPIQFAYTENTQCSMFSSFVVSYFFFCHFRFANNSKLTTTIISNKPLRLYGFDSLTKFLFNFLVYQFRCLQWKSGMDGQPPFVSIMCIFIFIFWAHLFSSVFLDSVTIWLLLVVGIRSIRICYIEKNPLCESTDAKKGQTKLNIVHNSPLM